MMTKPPDFTDLNVYSDAYANEFKDDENFDFFVGGTDLYKEVRKKISEGLEPEKALEASVISLLPLGLQVFTGPLSFVINEGTGENLSIPNDDLKTANEVVSSAVDFVLSTGSRFE